MTAGTYIDLFSGCGGLSLGLGNAGWRGVFAVEKDPSAFATFQHNMVDGKYSHFDWPDWLPAVACSIQELLKNYPIQLAELAGYVDLIAGAPPCQGFSLAGLRNSKDPRNKLSKEYIKMVQIIRPKYLLLENVRGFNSSFNHSSGGTASKPYSLVVKAAIERLGYRVFEDFVNTAAYGVPQVRTRFIMVGIREDVFVEDTLPFKMLNEIRRKFLESKDLPLKAISVREAIGDLEITKKGVQLVRHSGSLESGFKKLDYQPPKKPNKYQVLMRAGLVDGAQPNSMRLARHKEATIEKFELIRKSCRLGFTLNANEKKMVGTKKQAICVLDPAKPSKTITTLPDDLLHYKEARILTVRESARIQSFPDDFVFKGKYTTGGYMRKNECPRYTQVGNAVPPLLGEILGILLKEISQTTKETVAA